MPPPPSGCRCSSSRGLRLRDLEPETLLPEMPLGEHVVHDYRTTDAVAEGASGVVPARAAGGRNECCPMRTCADDRTAGGSTVAGLVLVRQRPGSAKGVIFMTIEDETGVANIIVWHKVFERYRAVVLGARFVRVHGKLQSAVRRHPCGRRAHRGLSAWLADLSEQGREIESLAHADEVKRPVHHDQRSGKDAQVADRKAYPRRSGLQGRL